MESIINFSIEELQSYYLRKPFLTKFYTYFVEHGYYNLLIKQVVYILNNTFLLFFSIFLVNCVQWDALLVENDEMHLADYIEIKKMFHLNAYNFILFICYIVYLISKIGSLINSIYKFKYIKHFYNVTLDISDKSLVNMKWETIIEKFHCVYKHEDINVFFINNKICLKDNYFVSLINKGKISETYLCPLMEWNLIYCFINPLFTDDYKFDRNFLFLNKTYVKKIQNRIFNVALLNFIFMPIILPFLCIRNIFKYGEKFYNNPSLIFARHWTHIAKWKFRNYNELYHEFHEKILNSYKHANEYSSMFPNKLLSTIAEFFLFVFSSLFIILVFISVVNEKALTRLYIFGDRNALWVLGILATLIAITKGFLNEKIVYYPDEKLNNLKAEINSLNIETKDEFFKMYRYHITSFVKDIYYTIKTPFDIYKYYFNCKSLLNFLNEITVNNVKLGHTNFYSDFKRENTYDFKTECSKETFNKNNPNYVFR